MKTLAVLTSGGDAPGMNAVIRSVVRKGIYHGFDVEGIERGYEGVINGEFKPLNLNSVAGIIQSGGTMLRTARSDAFRTITGFNQALSQLKYHHVDTLIVVGGDGSMAGAAKLAEAGVNTLVIPATIDQDMAGTDYTIGFDTALNTVLDAVNKIRDTAASHERVAVIEVMGRHSGHIALQAGLACGAEAILLPEIPVNMDEICQRLLHSYHRGKLYSIVMVAEGVAKGDEVATQIAQRTSFKPHVTVLGYIQRGGSPSAVDNIIGSQMGAQAVDSVLRGEFNRLISYRGGCLATIPYAEAFMTPHRIDQALYELAGILAQ